jgi:hypothetical protein
MFRYLLSVAVAPAGSASTRAHTVAAVAEVAVF